MEVKRLQQVLTAFAVAPADVDVRRGTVVVQIQEELIEAQLLQREGSLYVKENDEEFLAANWVIRRIARVQLLAERVLSHIPDEPTFVRPSGRLLDQLDRTPAEAEANVTDAGASALEILGRRPPGTASVLYLTADAGEGKTTLISQLAREQAQRYKNKQADWLIIPVSLGGRTFMRFDDVIVGALMNRLRFQLLYYDAFIELVRMGVLVPALDGFEEMFVEGAAGDAISALGNLMLSLQSSGSVLIAARKAYFEYKSLQTQAKLFDSLGGQEVSFARLALNRWDRSQFLEYGQKRGVRHPNDIYHEVSAKLGIEHPLLTRAVLVRELFKVAQDLSDRHLLLQKIEANPDDYFRQFVGTIISREAREKWINKVGEPAHPILTEQEHYDLLAAIALEMWTNRTETLNADVLGCVAEIFSESNRKSKTDVYQITERIKQHALIVSANDKRTQFSFDHQEFYHYFLGEAIGRTLLMKDGPGLRHALQQGALPGLTIDSAARYVIRNKGVVRELINVINKICKGEPRVSFVKDNLGGVIIRLLEYDAGQPIRIANASFPPQALASRRLTQVEFIECYFQSTSLDHASFDHCRFARCEFECFDLSDETHVADVFMEDCVFRSVVPVGTDSAVFAPNQITDSLARCGFTLTSVGGPSASDQTITPDEELTWVERVVRVFMRATGINENMLRHRFGAQSSAFFRDVLPQLESHRILVATPSTGSGNQRRYRLGVSLDSVNAALAQCGGSFQRFLELVDQRA